MPELRDRHDLNRLHFRILDDIQGGYTIASVVCGCASGLLTFFIAMNSWANRDTVRTATQQLTSTFERVDIEARQRLAEAYLTLHEFGPSSSITDLYANGTTSNALEELERTRQNGAVPVITYDTRGFYDWFVDYGIFIYGGLILLGMLIIFIGYLASLGEDGGFRRHYLMDLPWKQLWPYPLIILTLPVGLPFYLVSMVRIAVARVRLLRWFRPAQTAPVAPGNTADDADVVEHRTTVPMARIMLDDDMYETEYNYVSRPRTTSEVIGSLKDINAPVAARQTYIQMRTKKHDDRLMQRKHEAEEIVEDILDSLRRYGDSIKNLQRQLPAKRNEVKTIQAMLEERANTGAGVKQEEIEREFDKVLALPGVVAIGVVNDTIVVEVKAVIDYEGEQYDGGTWRIWFSFDGYYLNSREIRRGVRKTWLAANSGRRGVYPDYHMPHDTTFCFGGRKNDIDQYIQKGMYFEAIQLAVNCMNSVNEDDKENIPAALKKLSSKESKVVQETGGA